MCLLPKLLSRRVSIAVRAEGEIRDAHTSRFYLPRTDISRLTKNENNKRTKLFLFPHPIGLHRLCRVYTNVNLYKMFDVNQWVTKQEIFVNGLCPRGITSRLSLQADKITDNRIIITDKLVNTTGGYNFPYLKSYILGSEKGWLQNKIIEML